jgi:hypothetical protein
MDGSSRYSELIQMKRMKRERVMPNQRSQHDIEGDLHEARMRRLKAQNEMRQANARIDQLINLEQAVAYMEGIGRFMESVTADEALLVMPELQMYLERVKKTLVDAGAKVPENLDAYLKRITRAANIKREVEQKVKRDIKLAARPPLNEKAAQGTRCEATIDDNAGIACPKPAHYFTEQGNFCKIHARERKLDE